MELKELLKESFSQLIDKYDIKPVAKSKRIFSFYTLDDVPHTIKEQVKLEVEKIANQMKRKSFDIDHPVITSDRDGNWIIKGGIWTIRIL